MMEKTFIKEIEWDEYKMSVGNDTIDKQHQVLLEIINKLIKSINNETQMKDIEEILHQLTVNAKAHFKTEEVLFNKLIVDEKEIQDHLKEHDKFISIIDDINKKMTNNHYKSTYAIEALTELFNYISNWFVYHDIKEDKKIFLQSKN